MHGEGRAHRADQVSVSSCVGGSPGRQGGRMFPGGGGRGRGARGRGGRAVEGPHKKTGITAAAPFSSCHLTARPSFPQALGDLGQERVNPTPPPGFRTARVGGRLVAGKRAGAKEERCPCLALACGRPETACTPEPGRRSTGAGRGERCGK